LRIVIADGQASVREGLVLLLGGLPGIDVVGAAADGERALSERESAGTEKKYGGGAAAQPDADGGTACLACIARTGAPRGATPPHSVTIQACSYMYKS
jgi:hypothetical protein